MRGDESVRDHQLRGEKMMRKKVHKTRLKNLFAM